MAYENNPQNLPGFRPSVRYRGSAAPTGHPSLMALPGDGNSTFHQHRGSGDVPVIEHQLPILPLTSNEQQKATARDLELRIQGAFAGTRTAERSINGTTANVSSGPGQETSDRRGRHAAVRSGLPVSAVPIIASTGLLLVAAAYTIGRLGHSGSPWANRAYWLGQGLILGPIAAKLLGRRVLTAGETVTLVIVLTVTEYLAWICYSPPTFTFVDELEHFRSTVNVLQSGRLFSVNYLLPISPHYPGLEEVTSAFVSVTGLSAFTSGLIIAGVAHLLFVCVLYLLFREFSGSDRIAGIAMLCYASNPHFTSFDSMFIYQTLALPFLGLVLLGARRLSERGASRRRVSWLSFAIIAIATITVTHHVTSYVLIATLVITTLGALLTRDWPTATWAAAMALLSAAAAVSWLIFAAPQTLGYLQPFAYSTLHSIQALFAGGQSAAPSTSAGPLGNRMLSAGTVLIVSVLVPVGWWQVWRTYRYQPWVVSMTILSVGWYVTVAVRFAVADGSELAGRAATFAYVPTAFMVALAIGHLAGVTVRWLSRMAVLSAPVIVLTFIFNGLANGWPPYWERLPGPHQVAGADRSVGPEEIAAAQWTLSNLGPGNRFATDTGSYSVLGTYGDQLPLPKVAYLYTSSSFSVSDVSQAQAQALRYIWVDQRLSQSLPASGRYFPVDANAGKYTHPLPSADLDKFDRVRGIARIYDAGNIVIYELVGLLCADRQTSWSPLRQPFSPALQLCSMPLSQ